MNVRRLMTLPNVFKPLILIFSLLTMLLAGSAPVTSKESLNLSWFFWLSMILQLVMMFTVCGLFLYEAEAFFVCSGNDSWPIVEMLYCGVFATCNLFNTFILAGWQKNSSSTSSTFLIAALTTFLLLVFYGISGVMMYSIWKRFVKSGASQNPTPNLQSGHPGSIHPGI